MTRSLPSNLTSLVYNSPTDLLGVLQIHPLTPTPGPLHLLPLLVPLFPSLLPSSSFPLKHYLLVEAFSTSHPPLSKGGLLPHTPTSTRMGWEWHHLHKMDIDKYLENATSGCLWERKGDGWELGLVTVHGFMSLNFKSCAYIIILKFLYQIK